MLISFPNFASDIVKHDKFSCLWIACKLPDAIQHNLQCRYAPWISARIPEIKAVALKSWLSVSHKNMGMWEPGFEMSSNHGHEPAQWKTGSFVISVTTLMCMNTHMHQLKLTQLPQSNHWWMFAIAFSVACLHEQWFWWWIQMTAGPPILLSSNDQLFLWYDMDVDMILMCNAPTD